MEWRGVTTTNVYIGNFFFVAGIGMLISAQWELVKGNSFAYTVLSAFGTRSATGFPNHWLTERRTLLCWLRRSDHPELRRRAGVRRRYSAIQQCAWLVGAV
jgi:predicted acyltransferase